MGVSVIQWFRRLLALHQLIYLVSFLPDPSSWFAPGKMVIPEWTYPQVHSVLHFSESVWFANAIWCVIVMGWILLGVGKLSKLGQIVLLLLQISLHNANPLIIHEPQQIANFFLLVSILWPSSKNDDACVVMHRLMLAFLCCYYIFAGLKKLPDPLWIQGEALRILMQWPPLARDNFLNEFLLRHPAFLKFATWFTLIFELGFSFVVWTRWRLFLIPVGILFHLLIGLTFQVGTFGWIMMAWYAFLLRPDEQKKMI